MEKLVRRFIPFAPDLGLYVVPDLPQDKVQAAISDYAGSVSAEEVLCLYDATLLRSAKDGALFTADRVVFQNSDLTRPQEIRYRDIVEVTSEKKFLGGQKVIVHVNRGQATVKHVIDFSGRPRAAEFVERFLGEAMLAGEDSVAEENGPLPDASPEGERQAAERASTETRPATEVAAVLQAMQRLVDEGKLASADYQRIVGVLRG